MVRVDALSQWVDSLSLFLRKSELRLSARAGPGAVFVPDLVLQGLPHVHVLRSPASQAPL
jgi:hypothetical protein